MNDDRRRRLARMVRLATVEMPVDWLDVGSWTSYAAICEADELRNAHAADKMIVLDTKNTLIADEEQAKGTIDHVPVYPREVCKRALELNAASILLVHNHPSGDPTPSQSDIDMTARIATAAEALSIRVHDHLIIGKSAELSFRAEGLL